MSAAETPRHASYDTDINQSVNDENTYNVVDTFSMFAQRKSDYQLCLMGAAKSGKTALINCFMDNAEYEDEYVRTEYIDEYE